MWQSSRETDSNGRIDRTRAITCRIIVFDNLRKIRLIRYLLFLRVENAFKKVFRRIVFSGTKLAVCLVSRHGSGGSTDSRDSLPKPNEKHRKIKRMVFGPCGRKFSRIRTKWQFEEHMIEFSTFVCFPFFFFFFCYRLRLSHSHRHRPGTRTGST